MDEKPPQKKVHKEEVELTEEVYTGEEHTPEGWREELFGVISRDEGKRKKYRENLENILKGRSGELDIEAEKLGIVEKSFRKLGERYNKCGWKTKLAIGLSLGIGAGIGGATATASVPLAFACMSGIAMQRIAGMAGMFLKFEKSSQDGKWLGIETKGKTKAMLKSIGWTIGMTGVTLGLVWGVKEGIEHHDVIFEWLKNHYPFGSNSEVPAAPATGAGVHEVVSESTNAPGIATAPVTQEAIVTPEQVEMPTVEATRGRGYEYMAKRLWEQLQEKGLDASNYAEGSDIREMLEADASSIDKVVHQIAADPTHGHGFYNADGTSVRIDMGSQMTIDADGNIRLNDMLNAPENAPTTPIYPPAPVEQVDTAPSQIELQIESPPTEPPTQTVEHYTAPDQYIEQPQSTDGSDIVRDESGTPVIDSHGASVQTDAESQTPGVEHAPAQNSVEQATQPEVSNVSTPETQTFFTKIDNVQINPKAPAIYQAQTPSGETFLTAYGGSDEARYKLIQKFLLNPDNQGKSIRFTHTVNSTLGPKVMVDEIGARTNAGHTSWLLDFFKKPVPPPSPDTFIRRLSK